MFTWIDFNENTHRAFIGSDGIPIIQEIPAGLKKIWELESTAERIIACQAFFKKTNFPIDKVVDIDLWGVSQANNLRRAYGYTWITAFLMPNIQVSPGFRYGTTLQFYDPANAPIGAILVPPGF